MKYADLHIHSIYSTNFYKTNPSSLFDKILLDSLLKPEEILTIAKKLNLSAIAVTDHNTLSGSRAVQKLAPKYKITVIPGVEISSKIGHILAYGIKKDIPPKLKGSETITQIHNQNGVAALAHPYDMHPRRFLAFKKKRKFINCNFDAIEVASCVTGFSLKAHHLASRLNCAKIAGSDAHCRLAIGYGLTVFPDSCQSPKDYLLAIKNRKTFALKTSDSRLKIWWRTLIESWFRNLITRFENV